MAFLGREPTKAPLVTSDLPDNAVTLAKMTGGTDGQIITYDASGDPVAVGPGSDGEVLTSTGAGSPPAFEAAGGGITAASQWILNSAFTSAGSEAKEVLAANLQVNANDGYGGFGSAMTQSSGIFTFPETGIWWIIFTHECYYGGDARAVHGYIDTTTDDDSFS